MSRRMFGMYGLVVCLAVVSATVAQAAIVDFEGLPHASLTGIYANYAGVTWGTSTTRTTYSGNLPWWADSNSSYSTPHSGANYVYNGGGVDDLWFDFGSQVSFTGAWFAHGFGSLQFGGWASDVRFRDDLGNYSSWLSLSTTPQWLNASFAGATKIWVERAPLSTNNLWYTMDDVTYGAYDPGPGAVPELPPFALAALGLIPLGLKLRRRK